MSVPQMLASMDARDIAEWRAFFALEARAETERDLAATAASKLAAGSERGGVV